MSDWLTQVIGEELIAVYEGLDATDDALLCQLRDQFGTLWTLIHERPMS
jgi:hypothetical protein